LLCVSIPHSFHQGQLRALKNGRRVHLVVGQHKRVYGAHVGDLNRSHVCVFSLVQVVTFKGHPYLVRKSWVVTSLQQQQPTPWWDWALKPKSSFCQVLYENFFFLVKWKFQNSKMKWFWKFSITRSEKTKMVKISRFLDFFFNV